MSESLLQGSRPRALSWWPGTAGSELLDTRDLDDRQILTMALTLVVPGLVLELVDPDLGTLGLLDDLAGDADLGQSVGVGGDRRSIDDEDRGQRHGGTGLALDLLDLDMVPFGDLVLLAAGLDDRVHGGLPLASRVCGRPGGHTVCAVFLLALRLTSARIAGPDPSMGP